MTATVDENPARVDFTADALYADEPPEPDVSAGDEFTEIPQGFVRDRDTGEIRARRRAGRPRKPPSAEEVAAMPAAELKADQPPPTPGKHEPEEVPMPRGGVIAKGTDKLYRRAGKILRAFDHDLGQAVIECTKPDPDDPDALTVGQAWEQLAKTNPRVRRFLVNAIKGGTWQDLLMAHAPIAVALMTKQWVQRILPLGRLAESFLEPDEDTQPGDLRAADLDEMRDMAEGQAAKIARKMGVNVPAGVAEAAMRQAQDIAAGRQRARLTPPYEQHDLPSEEGGVPPAFRRQQPKRQTRAQRAR